MQVEDVTGETELDEDLEEDVCEEARPSIMMRKGKGKHLLQIFLHKQPEVMITLPHIPERVTIVPNIIGCVEKLRYSENDVVDKEIF